MKKSLKICQILKKQQVIKGINVQVVPMNLDLKMDAMG